VQVPPRPFEFLCDGSESSKLTHVSDSDVHPREPQVLRDRTEERLQLLNQEIVDLREQLAAVEDWDLYESAPLKHQIILYEDERNQLVGDHNRRVRRKLDETARRTRQVDAVRDEIDWCENKIGQLREDLRQSSNADSSELRKLLKGYEDYWDQLMRESGRLPSDCPTPSTVADPSGRAGRPQTDEFVGDQHVPGDDNPMHRTGSRRAVARSQARTHIRPRKDIRNHRSKRSWAIAFKAIFRKLSFVLRIRRRK